MRERPQTIRLGPKAYGIDWWRIARYLAVAALVAGWPAVKIG